MASFAAAAGERRTDLGVLGVVVVVVVVSVGGVVAPSSSSSSSSYNKNILCSKTCGGDEIIETKNMFSQRSGDK